MNHDQKILLLMFEQNGRMATEWHDHASRPIQQLWKRIDALLTAQLSELGREADLRCRSTCKELRDVITVDDLAEAYDSGLID